jgi:deoxycytidine triphosphate deaminase
MVLNKDKLVEYIEAGKIAFTPALDRFQLQPHSIDLRIGWSFYVAERWQFTEAGRVAIEPDYFVKGMNKDYWKLLKIRSGQYFELLPNELVLVASLERLQLNAGDLMAVLHPRSSMVRRGLVIQGGVVDTYYHGHLVIPILNSTSHSLKIYPGERAYQLVFHLLTGEISLEAAQEHGVEPAKYAESTPYNIEARTDSEEESDFIKQGNLEGLKHAFALKKEEAHA